MDDFKSRLSSSHWSNSPGSHSVQAIAQELHTRYTTHQAHYTRHTTHQVHYTPGTLHTRYTTHQVHYTPGTLHTRHATHQAHYTPGTLHTRHNTHQAHYSHSHMSHHHGPLLTCSHSYSKRLLRGDIESMQEDISSLKSKLSKYHTPPLFVLNATLVFTPPPPHTHV